MPTAARAENLLPRYRFADLAVDLGLRQASRAGSPLHLGRLTYDLLVALIEAAPNVITYDQLAERVWKGRLTTAQTIAQRIKLLRKALSDDASEPKYVEVVRGEGCRLIPRVVLDPRSPKPRVDGLARPHFAAQKRVEALGRESEIARLHVALSLAERGHGKTVLIHGEPGVGKTLLAEAFAEDAERTGATVSICDCAEEPGAPPYWPWSRVLADLAKRTNRPGLGELLLNDADTLAVEPAADAAISRLTGDALDRARYTLFQTVVQSLAECARSNLLVIALESLQWADASSLRLLEFLARSRAARRVLLVATYRDTEIAHNHQLSRTLGALVDEGRVERIPLRGLPIESVRALVERAAGQRVSRALVEEIHRRTDGNPFFAAEVSRAVADELAATSERRISVRMPYSISEAIGRHLSAVSRACNEVLSIAAVIGRTFETAQLRRLSTETPTRLLTYLDEAVDAALIEETEKLGRFRFCHALIAETLYEALPLSRRTAMHRDVAQMLELLHSDHIEPFLGEIAKHYHRAAQIGDVDKAIGVALSAAAYAERSPATADSAVANYLLALDLLRADCRDHTRQEAETWLALGRARWRSRAAAGQTAAALEAAVRCARVAHHERCFLAAVCDYVHTMMPAVTAKEVAYLDEALALTAAGDVYNRTRILSRKSSALHLLGRQEDAETAARQAIQVAQKTSDPWIRCDTLSWSLIALRPRPSTLPERIRLGEEALAQARSLPDPNAPLGPDAAISDATTRFASASCGESVGAGITRATWAICEAQQWLAVCYQEAGEMRRVEQIGMEMFSAFETSSAYEHTHLPYVCESIQALCALNDGRWQDAREHAEEAYRLGRVRGEAGAESVFSAQMFHLHRELGELRRFGSIVRSFADEHPRSARSPGLALAHAELGRLDAARRHLHDALSNDAVMTWSEGYVPSLTMLAETCVAVGDEAAGRILYDALLPYSGQMAVHVAAVSYGPVDRYLGMLARTCGRPNQAQAHFEDALDLSSRAGSKPWIAHTKHEYARLLSELGAKSRENETNALLVGARRVAAELGMHMLLDKIDNAADG